MTRTPRLLLGLAALLAILAGCTNPEPEDETLDGDQEPFEDGGDETAGASGDDASDSEPTEEVDAFGGDPDELADLDMDEAARIDEELAEMDDEDALGEDVPLISELFPDEELCDDWNTREPRTDCDHPTTSFIELYSSPMSFEIRTDAFDQDEFSLGVTAIGEHESGFQVAIQCDTLTADCTAFSGATYLPVDGWAPTGAITEEASGRFLAVFDDVDFDEADTPGFDLPDGLTNIDGTVPPGRYVVDQIETTTRALDWYSYHRFVGLPGPE